MILVERDRRRVRVSFMPMLLLAECVRTSDPGTDISAAAAKATKRAVERGRRAVKWTGDAQRVGMLGDGLGRCYLLRRASSCAVRAALAK